MIQTACRPVEVGWVVGQLRREIPCRRCQHGGRDVFSVPVFQGLHHGRHLSGPVSGGFSLAHRQGQGGGAHRLHGGNPEIVEPGEVCDSGDSGLRQQRLDRLPGLIGRNGPVSTGSMPDRGGVGVPEDSNRPVRPIRTVRLLGQLPRTKPGRFGHCFTLLSWSRHRGHEKSLKKIQRDLIAGERGRR